MEFAKLIEDGKIDITNMFKHFLELGESPTSAFYEIKSDLVDAFIELHDHLIDVDNKICLEKYK